MISCDKCGGSVGPVGYVLCGQCEPAADANHHRRTAEQLIAAATDHFTDSNRQDRPDAERAEAAKNCRLLSGLAFAHALLASPGDAP